MKSPKTPERSSSAIPQFPIVNSNNNNNNSSNSNTVQPSKPGTTQNLISPPPEFSNHKKIELTERHSTNGSSYPTVNTNPVHNINTQTRSSSSQSNRYTPTPTINYEEIRVPSRSSSREIVLRNSYSHQSTPRPSSSQSQYLDQRSSVSRTSNYTPNPSSYPPTSHQVKAIESYHYSTVDNNNSGNNTGNYQDGRESVRSPLTLSMDSGISSSGIVNRKFIVNLVLPPCCSDNNYGFLFSTGRVQGSSVSPSSFPSQTSPQGKLNFNDEWNEQKTKKTTSVSGVGCITKCRSFHENCHIPKLDSRRHAYNSTFIVAKRNIHNLTSIVGENAVALTNRTVSNLYNERTLHISSAKQHLSHMEWITSKRKWRQHKKKVRKTMWTKQLYHFLRCYLLFEWHTAVPWEETITNIWYNNFDNKI